MVQSIHPPPTPPTPPPPPPPTPPQYVQDCRPGLSRSTSCSTQCQGDYSNLYNICPTTFCAITQCPPGSPECAAPQLYPCNNMMRQPQYPPLPGVSPPPAGVPPVNPQSPPADNSCPPGEELECVDVFPPALSEINPAALPLVEEDHPYSPPALTQALPGVISVAVQGWDLLVRAINDGFTAITQSLASSLVTATLPAEGTVDRHIDSISSPLAKIDSKLSAAADMSIGEGIAYAAQLGIPPPSQADFDAINAGMPLSALSRSASNTGGGSGCNYPTVEEAAGLPELDFISDNYNTTCPPKFLGPSLGPCEVIGKDPKGDGSTSFYQAHQSQCLPVPVGSPPPHPLGLPPPHPVDPLPQDNPPPPVGVIQPVSPDQNCFVGGFPFHAFTNNPDGSITAYKDNGDSITIDPNDPSVQCFPGGNVLNPQPTGDLNTQPNGFLLPVPVGQLLPNPSGGLNTQPPGGGQCPPPQVNIPPCPPGGNNNIVVNPPPQGLGGSGNLNNQPPNVIINNPAGGSPNVNVVVNVPPPPTEKTPQTPANVDTGRDPLTSYGDWNALDVCKTLTSALLAGVSDTTSLSELMGWKVGDETVTTPSEAHQFILNVPEGWRKATVGFIKWAIDTTATVADSLVGNAGCHPGGSVGAVLSNMLVGFFDLLTSGSLAPLRVGYRQEINQACPQTIPGIGETNQARLTGNITQEQWECWTKANGHAPVPALQVLRSQYTRVDPQGLFELFWRGVFKIDEIDDMLKERGVLFDGDREQMRLLSFAKPTTGDVVRMMRMDALNLDVSAKDGLDQDFDERWNGKYEEYAKANHWDKEDLRAVFKSSSVLPDKNEIIDMLFRLTPEANDDAGVVTEDDVRRVLKAHGYADGWITKMIRVARPRITLREMRNLIVFSGYREDKVKPLFQQMGYLDEQATDLAKAYVRTALKSAGSFAGLPSEAEVVKLYQDDGISPDKAKEILKSFGHDDDAVQKILDTADAVVFAKLRTEKVRAIKSRYMKGEYSDSDALTQLQSAGVSFDRANQRVAAWSVEKGLDFKLPSAQQLCGLYGDGFIDAQTYFKRMQNLGWTDSDAYNFVNQCASRDAAKKAKELQAELKKQEQQAKQTLADEKKRLKEIRAAQKAAFPCAAPKKPTCPPGVVPPS